MKRKFISVSTIIVLLLLVIMAIIGNIVFQISLDNPLVAGEVFGPFMHKLSRTVPLELSDQQSTTFQGLQNPRVQPEEILVYDISDFSDIEKIRARSVQGLMNRDKPTLYLISSDDDRFWLSQMPYKKTEINNIEYSFQEIKYNPEDINQKYLAITLAGVYDAIPVVSSGNPIFDLTKMSEDEIYNLMLEVSEKTNKSMISFRNKNEPKYIDFVIKNRLFLSPLAISSSSTFLDLKKTDPKEAKIMEKIMSKMEPDCAMFGYNINPYIQGEFETIGYLSEHGCFSVPIPSVPNLSFFSSLPRATPQHSTPQSDIKLENKTYIVFVMSDADNIHLPYTKYENFAQNHKTPIGWSISPFLNELSPTMFEYYSSNLQEGDTFVAAPSGGGFNYPSKNKYLPALIQHTDRFMGEIDVHYIWVLDFIVGGYSPELLDRFAQISDGVFMEYVVLRPYSDSIEIYKDNTPAIFSSAFVEKEINIAERIADRTPDETPAFMFIGLEMRYNSPEHVDYEVSKLDPKKYEVVSVPEFIDLINQYHS